MTTALVLAGGKGTRLGGNLPKAMLEVNGKTLVQRQLDYLASVGVSDVVLCLGYLSDKVAYNAPNGVKLYRCVESSPLGTGGAVKLASVTFPLLFERAVYVLNVDDLAKLDESTLHLGLGLAESDEAQIVYARCIPFSVWAGNKMYAQNESYQHVGHTILTPNGVESLPEHGSLEEQLSKWSEQGIIQVVKFEGEWHTCNTEEQHREINNLITANETWAEIQTGKRTGI